MIRFVHDGFVYETRYANWELFAQGDISKMGLLVRSFKIKEFEPKDSKTCRIV